MEFVYALFWVLVGLLLGAIVWVPITIRENDRRWNAKLTRAERWRQRWGT